MDFAEFEFDESRPGTSKIWFYQKPETEMVEADAENMLI